MKIKSKSESNQVWNDEKNTLIANVAPSFLGDVFFFKPKS